MTCFIDTSAFLAILDRDDENHADASGLWRRIIDEDRYLITSSYILVETVALCQRRLGLEAVKAFHYDIMPLVKVEWIGPDEYGIAVSALIAAGRKKVSLVDHLSFTLMRRSPIVLAFAYDRHFLREGFHLLR